MSIGNALKTARVAVTSKAGRQLLKGQKHSPTILFGAGVIGFGVTVVMASKATLRLDEILEENELKQGEAHDLHELNRLGKENYSTKEYKKDQAILKVRLCKDLARLYGPSVLVGALSVGALTGSHVVLNRRYAGAVAAFSALDKSFKEYQERVKELAPDLDQKKLLNGVVSREVASEDGSKVETVYESEGRGPYARLFSRETSPNSWSPQSDYNFVFLQAQQRYANDLLDARGHVMLNDVFDSLGLERTKAGAVTGWVKNNKRGGDNRVDFGIFDEPDRFHDFMRGKEGAIWLDFNVDGIVYDLL